jgi:hypothetical protein
MRKGDTLKCLNDIYDFKAGETYQVLYVDNEKIYTMICLAGKLYTLDWVLSNFKKI